MTRTISPVIDDADVNRYVDLIRQHADFSRAAPEERADRLREAVVQISLAEGHSREYSDELARRVRQRMLWAKPLD